MTQHTPNGRARQVLVLGYPLGLFIPRSMPGPSDDAYHLTAEAHQVLGEQLAEHVATAVCERTVHAG